jgi:hypothetical protein
MKEIVRKIEEHLDLKTHKSALEVFTVLNEGQGVLKEIVEEDWFKYNFKQLENLVYSDEESWNTDLFKKDYERIIPMIVFKLKEVF